MKITIEMYDEKTSKEIDHDDVVFDDLMDHIKSVVVAAGYAEPLWDAYFMEEK